MNNEVKVVSKKGSQIRILDYMHIASKNLKNDSNFLFHTFLFKYLHRYYPNKFHFHTTYPQSFENDITMKELANKYKFITPVPIKYYSTNAFFRNALDWEGLQKNAPHYDIILNNTPEIAFELLSYSISKGIYTNIINYAHWYADMVNQPIFANYRPEQMARYCVEAKYFYNFLIAFKNYNNTNYGVQKILDGYEKLDNGKNFQKIKDKTETLYMSIDHEDIEKFKPEILDSPECPIVVFNHRHLAYTGFSDFMKTIERIIALRPTLKFRVWLTDSGNIDLRSKFNIPDEYYWKPENKGFPQYVKNLWNCQGIEVGPHTGNNQFSLAFLDGMFANLVPLYRRNIFFDEMFEGLTNINEYSFKSDDDFVSKLIYMIENLDSFRANNERILNHFKENWVWDKLIHKWVEVLEETYDDVRTYKDSNKIKTSNIEYPASLTKIKKELNISDQRPVNVYMKTLIQKDNLKEDMENSKRVFYRQDQPIRKTRGFF